MSYFIESLNNSIRKMLLSLFHWWGNWSSKRLSDSPKVTQLVSKVVWRPNKANSGKHSLYFVVWRPISWLRGVLGVEGCYSGLRGWWRPGKWKGQSWAMFWRAVAERGSCVRLKKVIWDAKWKWRWKVCTAQMELLQKGNGQGSQQVDGFTPTTLQPLHLVQCLAHKRREEGGRKDGSWELGRSQLTEKKKKMQGIKEQVYLK